MEGGEGQWLRRGDGAEEGGGKEKIGDDRGKGCLLLNGSLVAPLIFSDSVITNFLLVLRVK